MVVFAGQDRDQAVRRSIPVEAQQPAVWKS
jgi:hypothetical protein